MAEKIVVLSQSSGTGSSVVTADKRETFAKSVGKSTDTPLTIVERQQLTACMKVINEGLNTFIAVGNALMEVQKNILYRETYDTFEQFCDKTFGLSSRRAYQLIEAAETVNLLSTTGAESPVRLPETESHAKALANIEPEIAREVWNSVVAESQSSGEKITAEKIAQTKEQLTGKAPKTKTKSASFADERRPKDKLSEVGLESTRLLKNNPLGTENGDIETAQQKLVEIKASSTVEDTGQANSDYLNNSDTQSLQADTSSTGGNQAVSSLLATVDQEAELTSLFKLASARSFNKEIIVIVTGKFLLRTGLTKPWIKIRGLPANFAVTEDFYDQLSLREARNLGLI